MSKPVKQSFYNDHILQWLKATKMSPEKAPLPAAHYSAMHETKLGQIYLCLNSILFNSSIFMQSCFLFFSRCSLPNASDILEESEGTTSAMSRKH